MASLNTEIVIRFDDEAKQLVQRFIEKVEWLQAKEDSWTIEQPDIQVITDHVLDKTPQQEVGKRIKAMREFACLTEKELSERSGISEGFLVKYEMGKRKPNAKTLKKIANALKIDVRILSEEWK